MDKLFNSVPAWAVIIGFFVFLFIVLILFMRWSSKRTAGILEPAASALGGEIISGWLSDPYLLLRTDKFDARVKLDSGNEDKAPSLILHLMTTLPFTLDITLENIATNSLRKLGLKLDFQTGNKAFDDKYLLRSAKANQAKSFLLSSAKREIVEYFFSNGFTRLSASDQSVFAEKQGYGPDDLKPEAIRSRLEQLNKFVAS